MLLGWGPAAYLSAAPAHECCKIAAGEEAGTGSELEAPQRDLLQHRHVASQKCSRSRGTVADMAPKLKILGLTPARHQTMIESAVG